MEIINLLIAEDNDDYLTVLKHIFSDANGSSNQDYVFNIKTCESFSGIIDIINDNKDIDIVLLDLNLSDINWTDTVRRFVDNFPDMPFCVMSALCSYSYALYAMKHGAQDYFCKSDRRNIRERMAFALSRAEFQKSE